MSGYDTEKMPGLGLKPMRTQDIMFGKDFKKSIFNLSRFRPDQISFTYGMPPVLNQGPYGTCGAHAAAALQGFFNFKRDQNTKPISRRAIYTQTKYSFEPNDFNDDGLYLVDILKTMSAWGWVPETLIPYPTNPNDFDYFKLPISKGLWQRNRLVKEWVDIPVEVDSLKQGLWQHGPIILAIKVPAEWYTFNIPPSGILPIPSATQGPCGAHAILLVGYDDVKQCFQIRNSWGPQWADKGYAWIPYAVVEQKLTGAPYQALAVASI